MDELASRFYNINTKLDEFIKIDTLNVSVHNDDGSIFLKFLLGKTVNYTMGLRNNNIITKMLDAFVNSRYHLKEIDDNYSNQYSKKFIITFDNTTLHISFGGIGEYDSVKNKYEYNYAIVKITISEVYLFNSFEFVIPSYDCFDPIISALFVAKDFMKITKNI